MKNPDEDRGAGPLIPSQPTISKLREAARDCRACPLWKTGTQTVFGEGPCNATVVFLGEQPGNDEDLAGKPFVGPAGKLLDRALVEAGIDRTAVYVTNAVKHFKWELRGKRRIHKKPNSREIAACRPWLEAELATLRACFENRSGKGLRARRGGWRGSPPRRASLICSDSTREHIREKSVTEEQRSQPPRPSTARQCSPIICSASARPPEIFSKHALKPKLLVCLGATAAQAMFGKDFRVSQRHGQFVETSLAEKAMATVHPSSILRAPSPEDREAQLKQFIADLKKSANLFIENRQIAAPAAETTAHRRFAPPKRQG